VVRVAATSIVQRIKPIAQQLTNIVMRRINLGASPGTGLWRPDWLNSLLDKYCRRRNRWPYPIGLVLFMPAVAEHECGSGRVSVQNVFPRLNVRIPAITMILNLPKTRFTAERDVGTGSLIVSTLPSVASPKATGQGVIASPPPVAYGLRPVVVRTNGAAVSLRERGAEHLTTLVSYPACKASDARDSRRDGQLLQVTAGQQTHRLLQRIVHQFRRIEHRFIRLPGEAGQHASVDAKPQVVCDLSQKSPGGEDSQYAAVSTRPGLESEFGTTGSPQSAHSGGMADLNLSSVTDHVMRQLDQRFTAWRERMGQV
jgi:hypothetical protein